MSSCKEDYTILRVSCSKSPVEYQYSVQRRAVRFVKNEYSTTPGTVTKILNDLKQPTLEKRRKVAQLTMMFKVVSGLSVSIQFPPFIFFERRQGLGNSILRNLFKLALKQTNTNTVLLYVQSETGTPYQIVPLKSRVSVEAFEKAVMGHL